MQKTLFAILLIALNTFYLMAETNRIRVVDQAEKTTDIVPMRYQTVNRERAACIIFVTDLEVELDFVPNVELIAAVQEALGQWNVYVSPFERRIDVFAFGYEPLIVILREFGIRNLQSGDVYRLRLTGDRADVRSIENINIVVTTQPRNAVVYLNENRVEDPRQILAPMGRNTIRIELDGYKSIIEEIEVSEQRTLFEYRMDLTMNVPVSINTEPEGATVFLNDVNCGRTPLQFFYQEGEYNLRIVLENYAPVEEVIEIKEPQTVKSYKLEDIRGTLTIKTGSSSSIFINNEPYPHGVTNLKLSPGLVQLRITNPKAQDIIRSMVIRGKEHQEIEIYSQINTGTIIVSVMPVNARVELTGDAGERFSSQGGQTFRDVPVGKYRLEIKADGHRIHRASFDVMKDDVIRKQLILEEGVDEISVSINSKPAGADIYADGKRLGRTPVRVNLPVGNNRIVLKKVDYFEYHENINVTEHRTNFTFEMKVDPVSKAARERVIKDLYRIAYNKAWIIDNIIPSLNYDTKVSLIYFHGIPTISIPGLRRATMLFKEFDYKPTFSSFTRGFGIFDEILFSIDEEDGFWGLNYLSLGLGYFLATNNHKVRFFWDVDFALNHLKSYRTYEYRFNDDSIDRIHYVLSYPIKSEINLEIYTGLKSFFVLTAGIIYLTDWSILSRLTFKDGDEDYHVDRMIAPYPIETGIQPYFGIGYHF